MELVPILDSARRNSALDLLLEGFHNDPEHWKQAFEAPGSEEFGHGYLLMEERAFHGVILLFEHKREIYGKYTRFINLSSWYIRKQYRSLAPFMLAAITKSKDVVYTNLSASENARSILESLRFRIIAPGATLLPPLPLAGRRPRDPVQVVLGETGHRGAPSDHLGFLDEHSRRNFIVGHFEHRGASVPFAFFPVHRKGLLLPLLVYCPDPGRLVDALPVVFRRLVWRYRASALLLPRRDGFESVKGIVRPHMFCIHAKGPAPNAEIDHFYSEFYFLHKAMSRNVF